MSFLGLRALVAEPDVVWEEWDAAIYSALEERGFDVVYGAPLIDAEELSRYHLVALNIRRHLTEQEEQALTRYVADGGAVYGSWGGPMAAPHFLEQVLRVRNVRSVYLDRITLLDSPLTAGLPMRGVSLPDYVGHQQRPDRGWEMVAMDALPGSIPVARSDPGEVLGALSEYGAGRAAVLGFGPEQEKNLTPPELGPDLLDNLLEWLLAPRLDSDSRWWSQRVRIALPARTRVTAVGVDDQPAAGVREWRAGSLRYVEIPVDTVPPGAEADVCIRYHPLTAARSVETMIHLPWGTLRAAADSPARLADYLASLGATIFQPLLRGSNGQAWYRGMPEDNADAKLVAEYHGDFLADLIRECHQRGVRVIGGLYLDNATPTRVYPEVVQRDATGVEKKDRYGNPLACFNDPKAQEHNLATVEQLLSHYQLDGLILDDNYELDWYINTCFCQQCEAGFARYCEEHGLRYSVPSQSEPYSRPSARHEYRRQCTRQLVGKIRELAQRHARPLGGWVSVALDAAHLAGTADFLGGMAYTSPPRVLRAVLPRLGDCEMLVLLWAPHSDPSAMVREVREAIHAGASAVGFWVMGEDGGYQMDPARTEAIRSAFSGVEEEWRRYYQEHLLGGDGRFAVVEAVVGPSDLRVRVRNTGGAVSVRLQGPLALEFPGVKQARCPSASPGDPPGA